MLVAIDSQQPIPRLDAPSSRARLVDVQDKPTPAIRRGTPARSFLDTVVTGDGVDCEREQARVHYTDQEHDPEKYRSTGLITH